MIWIQVSSDDGRAWGLYRRHYSAVPKPNGYIQRKFVPPGERMVLLTPEQNALFVWSLEQFRADGQEGVNCSVFRNEGDRQSSTLILEAEKMARERWGDVKMFTYVDGRKIQSPNPGYCFKKAGWQFKGRSLKGLDLLVKYDG